MKRAFTIGNTSFQEGARVRVENFSAAIDGCLGSISGIKTLGGVDYFLVVIGGKQLMCRPIHLVREDLSAEDLDRLGYRYCSSPVED